MKEIIIDAKLPLLTKLSYALPAFSLAVIGIPVYVYMPKFYTDVIGLNIAYVGGVLLAARIFDAVTDPAIGLLSDRTVSRFGRRRPWIAIGSFFTAAAVILLFNPSVTGNINLNYHFAVSVFMLFLFWTIVVVPYESLGPELTFNYNDRNSLFSFRDGFLIAGTLAAAASPAIVKGITGAASSPEDERYVFFILSVIYAPLIIISCLWCITVLKEKNISEKREHLSIIKGLSYTFKNRPFLILLAAYTISAIGNNLPATLILFYVQYVLHSPLADLFLLLYFITGILFLPLWIKAAERFGKKNAWLSAMAINTGAFTGVFLLGAGDTVMYGILVFLSGTGFGATLALPSSMQADIIDYDELMTGERREGQYVGIWSFAKKAAAAFGVGIGLTILGLSGYEPNIQQSESVTFTLRVLYALVPCLCNAAGFMIALYYPITGAEFEKIRKSIQEKKGV
ncbi:MAG: MFS transporter [Spirochaetae bacterium HGW-Spirochaetae-5]|nr:MAG: MFS transporter [Spirochaetae bacterium HGW-Spirochaetae-5]